MPAEVWSGAAYWQDSFAADITGATSALTSSINKSLVPHFASRAARNTALVSIPSGSRIGLKCTVDDYGLCVYDGNTRSGSAGWTWMSFPVLLHNGAGVGATSSTAPNNISTFAFTAVTKRKLLIITESRCQKDSTWWTQGRVFLAGNGVADNRQEVTLNSGEGGPIGEMHVSRTWMIEAGPGDLSYTYKALRVTGGAASIFSARGTMQIWDMGPAD